jgi:hypothetical protein
MNVLKSIVGTVLVIGSLVWGCFVIVASLQGMVSVAAMPLMASVRF